MVLSLFLILIGAWVFTRGMFFDGQQYAIVAMNMAKNKGSFWFPYVTESWISIRNHAFLEQFTLGFFIESWWFTVLPKSNYTEKIFCASCLIINGYWLMKLSKLIAKQNNIIVDKFAVFVVLIWLIIPTVFWSFSNNVLEIIMSVFCTMAVYYQFKSLQNNAIVHVIFSGLLIVASLFSKGLPGLFVLSFYGMSAIFGHLTYAKAILYSFLQIGIIVIVFLILFQIPDAKESITYYINERLLGRIQSAHTVSNRFTILIYLLNDLIFGIILILISWISKNITQKFIQKKVTLFWFTFSICGVLPIMLTKVQKAFYILQVFPFIAISLVLLCFPLFDKWLKYLSANQKAFSAFKIFNYILFVGSIFFTLLQYKGYSRHKSELEDIDKIAAFVHNQKMVSLTKSLQDDWYIYFYIARFANTSGMSDTLQPFIIARKNEVLPSNYSTIKQFQKLQIGKNNN